MSHSITAKLNQAAREFSNDNGVTFFVSLGEKNYDFKTKQNVWTNYEAALFAKDAQIEFYRSSLVEHAVIEVTGTGIVLDASNPEYKPKLIIQDAKLGFINSPQGAPQQQAAPQQQQNQGGFSNHPQNNAGQQPNNQGFGGAHQQYNNQGQQNQQPQQYQQDNKPPF